MRGALEFAAAVDWNTSCHCGIVRRPEVRICASCLVSVSEGTVLTQLPSPRALAAWEKSLRESSIRMCETPVSSDDASTIHRYPLPTTVSAQARAMLSMPAKRPVYPAPEDVEEWLDQIRVGDEFLRTVLPPIPDSIVGEERSVNGVRVFTHRPAAAAPGSPIYLDLHPGGLIQLGGEPCRLLGGLIAGWLGMEVWSVDYRMPPLHPFPAALDDCITVYRELTTLMESVDVFVGGVSAGGNVAAALLLRAKDEQLPMPVALYLGTPEADLTESGDSFAVNRDADNTLASLRDVNTLYANGRDLTLPYISPLFGDLSGFPPTILSSGTRDLFLSNTVRMHRKLRAAGVQADLHVFEAMPHTGFGPGSPEDLDLRNEISAFLQSHRRTSTTSRP